MTNNTMLGKQSKPVNGWPYVLLLIVSFIWISLYPASIMLIDNFYFGFGNIFDVQSINFYSIVTVLLTEAIFYWISFEIIFYFYRYVLAYKIYSFIVPLDRLKVESRIFFIYRNVFYGIFVNICFLYPFLYAYAGFVDLVITFATLIAYSSHLNKTYAEPIIGHFVFKNFCVPVFVYEALTVFMQIVEVLA